MPKPYRYIGANEFFGYGVDNDEIKPMPLIRKITETNFVNTRKKTVGDLPDSLKYAMKCFLISIAVRNCRGEINKPNTMLIHVARIKNMQEMLERKVRDYFCNELQPMIIDGDRETKEEIYRIMKNDYVPTTNSMINDFRRYMEGAENFSLDEVYQEILRLMNDEKIRINVINGL